MTRFLSLDARTRASLVQGIQEAWCKSDAERIISFVEEMPPEVVVDFLGRVRAARPDGAAAKSLAAVVDALKTGKPKGGDWRLSPRTSRKQVANAGGRKHK